MFVQESFTRPSNSEQSTKRLEYIDLAKGIVIILVVIRHIANFSFPETDIIRMPLYYTLSGLFFKRYNNLNDFVIKKANNLLIPLLFFLFIPTLCFGFIDIKHFNFFEFLHSPNWTNYPIWFLLSLIYVNFIFYLISIITRNSFIYILISLLCAIIGYSIKDSGYLFFLDSSLIAMPFFILGYLLKDTILTSSNSKMLKSLLYGIILMNLAYLIFYNTSKPGIDFYNKSFRGDSIVMTYICCALAVIGTLYICKAIKWLPLITYIGRHSIILLGMHIPLSILFGTALDLSCLYVLGYKLSDSNRIAIILPLVLIGCWFSIPFCKKFIPQFVAQKSLLNKEQLIGYYNHIIYFTSKIKKYIYSINERNNRLNGGGITYCYSTF